MTPLGNRVILHLDLDAFYASVEQRENPALKGKAVIVGADPREGRGRGVVTTASYEARRLGVKSAMPISHAWRLCPDGVYVWPRFELYSAASAGVFEILRASGATVEGASIDEAYLDVSDLCADLDAAEALAKRLQAEIEAGAGITASVGIAASKVVAKIAGDEAKTRARAAEKRITDPESAWPPGHGERLVVPPGAEEAFLAPLPARRIPGVGPKTEELLASKGVHTCADLAATAPDVLLGWLGSWGPHLRDLARGIDGAPVVSEWARKSMGSETTFFEDVKEKESVARTVDELADGVAASLVAERLSARTVTLKLRVSDFTTFTRAVTLPRATRDAVTIRGAARELLDASWPEGKSIRLVGVRLTGLSDSARKERALDDFPESAEVDVAAWMWRGRATLDDWE
ncbi:MAG: DNA polymerase IV [Thermoplasmatota archaeon]